MDTVCAALVLFTLCGEKVSAVGLRVTDMVADEPVPVRVTVCGEPVALSAIVNVAARVPVVVGLKVMLIWQLLPDESAVPQVLALMAKSPGFAPVRVKPVKFTGAVRVLESVIPCALLVLPTFCEAKVRLVALVLKVWVTA